MDFKEFLAEKPIGMSTFDSVMKGWLVLSPRAIERAFGGAQITRGFHVTDLGGLKDLMKLEGKRASISIATKIDEELIGGLMTTGGIVMVLEGSLLYKSKVDLYTQTTKEGLRAIGLNSLPEDVADIVMTAWQDAFIAGINDIIRRMDTDQGARDYLESIINFLKNPRSNPSMKFKGREIHYELRDLFRPGLNVKRGPGDTPNQTPLEWDEKELKELRKSMRVVVSEYIDKLEKQLPKVSKKIIKGIEAQTGNVTGWNELIITQPKIKSIILVEEKLRDLVSAEEIKEKTIAGKYKTIIVETVRDFLQKYGNYFTEEYIEEAEYKGKKVELDKPFRLKGEDKKFGVYVKNDKGNVIVVKFGDPNMEIKRDDPERRKSFRARHNCDDKNDKTTAGYWSCKMWDKGKSVSDVLSDSFKSDLERIGTGIAEEWVKSIKTPTDTVEIFKNPSPSELRSVPKGGGQVVRAIVMPNGDAYVFDPEFLHRDATDAMPELKKGKKMTIYFGLDWIRLSEDEFNVSRDYLDKSKWISRYCKGFKFQYDRDTREDVIIK